MIRDARISDAAAMVEIYNHYILHSAITFEESPIQASEMALRIQSVIDDGLPWLVSMDNNRLIGYAYGTKWKARSAYRFSVESTVYLDKEFHGRGEGFRLYQALLEALRARGMHSVVGGITLPNPASVALHEKLGMNKVAHFERIGYKFGCWQDVGYWQINLLPSSEQDA